MRIELKCVSPKRLRGEHQFPSWVAFAEWPVGKPRAKYGVGQALCALAEHGSWNPNKIGCQMRATADVRYGYDAKELARRVGVLRLGETWSKDLQVALQYAKELDKLGSP